MIRRAALALAVVAAAGCQPPLQTAACKQYIACQVAYDQASNTGPVDITQYEADGACWGDVNSSQTCDNQCADGLVAIRTAATNGNLDVPACE